MTDRELWVKTCKTVGAMTGGTLLLLGSMSVLLMLVVGRPATTSPEVSDAPGVPTASDVGRAETTTPPPAAKLRHGHGRPGEAI
jgi:hypothetical protein